MADFLANLAMDQASSSQAFHPTAHFWHEAVPEFLMNDLHPWSMASLGSHIVSSFAFQGFRFPLKLSGTFNAHNRLHLHHHQFVGADSFIVWRALATPASQRASSPTKKLGRLTDCKSSRKHSFASLLDRVCLTHHATPGAGRSVPSLGQTPRLRAAATTLELTTKTAQSSLDSLLAKEAASTHTSHEKFWISNQKVIKGATIELVEKLAANPEIAEIREEIWVSLPSITIASNATRASVQASEPEWGVTKIDAPSVWAAGVTGQNVVIGSLDTGVVATHTSIAGNFRSTHNWFDAAANKMEPYDDLSHGTHTIGTMVGSNGLGVAPGAKFIACKAFTEQGASESWLLGCAQFLTCPTDALGNNKDCSQAPHIGSNSWGSSNGAAWFESSIKAWRAANIIPVFANGNSGPWCTTTLAPADSPDAIAVGATDSNDGVAYFSSKGPTRSGVIKPDLSAPGEDVRSAWNTSDTAFETASGTSMATPHVSGIIALLLSKKPTLTYDQIKSALGSTTDRKLKPSIMKCGGTADSVAPNNQYGYGRVNAFSAYKSIA